MIRADIQYFTVRQQNKFYFFILFLFFQVVIKWPDNRRENRGINLVCYGDPKGYSAMAKTVGFPCAIATRYDFLKIILIIK